uniref:Uncharacterized protein LOC101512697 n=1 Tax=Cicer arietinum TaxID=3827 RepID=A0A1S3EGD1_CICAR|nr:uncharacterized protein LOC101512697 [Cicer arietinum]
MLGSNFKSIWLLAMLAMSLCHYQYVNAEDCENDIQGLNIECMVYMQKIGGQINPSDRCCDVIKTANVPCVCKNGLSRKLTFSPYPGTYADLINWKKVMYCFNYCGRPLPRGLKCDRFTVPWNATIQSN